MLSSGTAVSRESVCLSHGMGEVCVNLSGANVLFQLPCCAENKRVFDFPGQVAVTHYDCVCKSDQKNRKDPYTCSASRKGRTWCHECKLLTIFMNWYRGSVSVWTFSYDLIHINSKIHIIFIHLSLYGFFMR